jgi:hypothetical protein
MVENTLFCYRNFYIKTRKKVRYYNLKVDLLEVEAEE